jgi:uncharacterized protein YdhG (YjbR/CyaY superfamily)
LNQRYTSVSKEQPMKTTRAETVEAYLNDLPDDRREILETVRGTILEHLPPGYEETMNWGMISYQVPLETYPDTYNGKPLMYAALANQKNHLSLYLTGVYLSDENREAFAEAYQKTGKRMDLGKSCVRFRKLEDLPLELIGETIEVLPVPDFIAAFQAARSRGKKSS